MSQKPQKPIRQDYIAKVRYTNNLPPPPVNPKFIKYNTTEKTAPKIEASQLMSSLFRKENFHCLMQNVDEELGLNLNLINNEGFLDNNNHSSIFKYGEGEAPVQLHVKDRALLRDAGVGKISKSEPGVSFLRRTEYISERHAPKSSIVDQVNPVTNNDEHLDPDSQLKAVEETFERSQLSLQGLNTLQHPRKKKLKAVSTWPLLPDTSMMDTKYHVVKFTGSASMNREFHALKSKQKDSYDDEFQKNSLSTAIFKPIRTEDGEWMSLYKIENAAEAAELKAKLKSTEKERPVSLLDEDESVDNYTFKHFKNYDMNFHKFARSNEELSIKFVPSKDNEKKRVLGYYYPVNGRIELKKHRQSTNAEVNRFLRESTFDEINFKLREPNTSELKNMDKMRSEFDPMEYEGDDEEPEEDNEKSDISHQGDAHEVAASNNESQTNLDVKSETAGLSSEQPNIEAVDSIENNGRSEETQDIVKPEN
ncbi:uncharacterized protein PRCAT00003396001 [Priceomyces carsonii]|uniref:uncharacterized protein n=1 Tax=Priceomyces carsonii TaxID=28549 RepID=UPI002ED86969|nr:unnamed protein product [Priceomyces carsonii]